MPRGVGVVCLWLLMEWFVWMWRVALSLMTVGTRPDVRTGRQFITNTEMAMRYRGVGGREVGVKCGGMQECYVNGRPGVRPCPSIM